jgi:dipeptidase
MEQWLDYAQGYNLTNRMPLFVPIQNKLTVNDTMFLMRTHFENTWFDNEGTVRVFRQEFTLEDAIGSHACSLEALAYV